MWSQYINIEISSLLLWPIDPLLSDALLYFYDNKRILIQILNHFADWQLILVYKSLISYSRYNRIFYIIIVRNIKYHSYTSYMYVMWYMRCMEYHKYMKLDT